MKIVVVQENLKSALSICGRAVASSTTLAILGNILLKTENGMLKISATNLEISISQLVRCKVEEDGVVCLPAKLLTEVVGSLPAEPVTLETVSEGVRLSVGSYRTVLKTVSPEDFPTINDTLPGQSFSLPVAELKRALEGVSFAVSTNETQVELCGVYMAVKSGVLVLTGTDRYRLAESRMVLPKASAVPDFSVILPARAVAEIIRLSAASPAEFAMGISDNQAVCAIGDTILTTRLVDAQYPEYEAIVPKEFQVSIKASRPELVAALRAVSVFAKGASGVSVKYEENQVNGLILSAKSQDAGEGVVEVPADVIGDTNTVLFNHKYLLDCLQFLTSEQVQVKLNNPASPVVFQDPANKDYMYLVMPIKT